MVSTLCFIIRVLIWKKSNIPDCSGQFYISRCHIIPMANTIFLSRGIEKVSKQVRDIQFLFAPFKIGKQIANSNREIPRNNYKIIFFILWIFSCILFMTSIFLPWKACKTTFCWPCFNLNTTVYCDQLYR